MRSLVPPCFPLLGPVAVLLFCASPSLQAAATLPPGFIAP
jgi:hypothetical protein